MGIRSSIKQTKRITLMAKKRVLNSKNPKYQQQDTTNKPKLKKRVLMCEVKGCKLYGNWYEDENIEDKV
jgi:hypothetical protein